PRSEVIARPSSELGHRCPVIGYRVKEGISTLKARRFAGTVSLDGRSRSEAEPTTGLGGESTHARTRTRSLKSGGSRQPVSCDHSRRTQSCTHHSLAGTKSSVEDVGGSRFRC
ncbi:hypothetical protein LSH36_1047g00031, partial [Paralvinella palmiformis]